MNTKRGDMPATGNNLDPQTAGCMSEFEGGVRVDDLGRWNSGLTIREQFAMAMAQGLVTAQKQDGEWHHDALTIAQTSVEYADALLAEMEKSK